MGSKSKEYYTDTIGGLCGETPIKTTQKVLEITVDGIISPIFDRIKALQYALNNNKLS